MNWIIWTWRGVLYSLGRTPNGLLWSRGYRVWRVASWIPWLCVLRYDQD